MQKKCVKWKIGGKTSIQIWVPHFKAVTRKKKNYIKTKEYVEQ